MDMHLLPLMEHAAAVAEIEAQARAGNCSCGDPKAVDSPFCGACRSVLCHSGFAGWLGWVDGSQRPAKWRRGPFDWQTYDLLTDVALALRTGRWDGKRARRKEDA